MRSSSAAEYSGDQSFISNFGSNCLWQVISVVFQSRCGTSPDDQFWTNSVIIEGAREVMLVDAQLTKNQC